MYKVLKINNSSWIVNDSDIHTLKKYLMAIQYEWNKFQHFEIQNDCKFSYGIYQYIKNSDLDSNIKSILESMLKFYSDSEVKFNNSLLQQLYPTNIFLTNPVQYVSEQNVTDKKSNYSINADIKFIDWAINFLK